MIMPTKPTMVEIDMSQLEDALRRAEAKLDEKDFAMLKALVESYAYLTDLVGDKKHVHRPPAKVVLRSKDREDRGGDRRRQGFAASANRGGNCFDRRGGGSRRRNRGSPRHGQRKRGGNAGQGPRPQWG